jgi:hypothetical protein
MIFGQTIQVRGGSHYPTLDVGVIEVDTSTLASVIYLPNIFESSALANNYKIVIVDISNNASTNPITVIASNGQKINGSTSILLNNDGVTAGFVPFANQYWIGNYDAGNSSPVNPIVQADSGLNSTKRIASSNCASGAYSTAFGEKNTASGCYSTVMGRCNTVVGNESTIAGGFCNFVNQGTGSSNYVNGSNFIGGGDCNYIGGNTLSGWYAGGNAIVGGVCNSINRTESSTYMAFNTILGGNNNTIDGESVGSTIIGGYNNSISGYGYYSTIIGGFCNNALNNGLVGVGILHSATGLRSAVVNGRGNTSSGIYAIIGNGRINTASGSYSAVVNGKCNVAVGNGSFIGGGCFNYVGQGLSTGCFPVSPNFIGSGECNYIGGNTCASEFYGGGGNTISGGWCNFINKTESAYNHVNVISGGIRNNIVGGQANFIGGGMCNTVSAIYFGMVASGVKNTASAYLSAILSGAENTASNYRATILNGFRNTASASYSQALNGRFNSSSGCFSTIVNGRDNTASGLRSFIAGGCANNTCGCQDAFIVGSSICANDVCATFVNKLYAINLPNSVGSVQQFGFYYDPTTCLVYFKP